MAYTLETLIKIYLKLKHTININLLKLLLIFTVGWLQNIESLLNVFNEIFKK